MRRQYINLCNTLPSELLRFLSTNRLTRGLHWALIEFAPMTCSPVEGGTVENMQAREIAYSLERRVHESVFVLTTLEEIIQYAAPLGENLDSMGVVGFLSSNPIDFAGSVDEVITKGLISCLSVDCSCWELLSPKEEFLSDLVRDIIECFPDAELVAPAK